MKLSDFAFNDDGLPAGFGARIVGGRAVYVEAGWMWRERDAHQTFLSRDGSYERRRYLPPDTEIELVKLQNGQ